MDIIEEGEYARVAIVSGKPFLLRYDAFGYAVAVTCDGVDILHLVPGACRNIVAASSFIEHINEMHKVCNQRVIKAEDGKGISS